MCCKTYDVRSRSVAVDVLQGEYGREHNLIGGIVEERQYRGKGLFGESPGRQPYLAKNIGRPGARSGFGGLG
ncbi:hypothetical protein EDF57_1104 [Novosphingobium sp. PhB55]|nr:hypothetical protein EDF57_1104 [Novosphingobium sp. PhB55]